MEIRIGISERVARDLVDRNRARLAAIAAYEAYLFGVGDALGIARTDLIAWDADDRILIARGPAAEGDGEPLAAAEVTDAAAE